MGRSHFWHPPAWKWIAVLVLVACSAFLALRRPPLRPVKVELLPFTESRPAWNGSFPYLVISPVDLEADHVKFESSISRVQPTVHHDSPVNEFEVDLHSGMFVLRQTDLFVPDEHPLSLTRTYRVWDPHIRAFGAGANHPYDICPTGTRLPYTYMNLNLEDGRQIYFRRISKGTGYADAVFRHDETSSEFYGAQIAWNGDGWTLNFRDGRQVLFPEAYYSKSYAQGAPFEMRDASGHGIQLKRDQRRNLQRLISPSGRTVSLKYDQADRIVQAADDAGNVRNYSYSSSGHLETVADASQVLYRFEYAPLLDAPGYDPYLMTTVTDGNWRILLRNTYRDRSRISEQRLADGEIIRYDYIFDKNHEIVETIVSLPGGGERKFHFEHGIPTENE